MKILDKYVLREMIPPFLVSVFAFLVLLIGRVIFDNIDYIVIKRVPLGLVVRLIVYQIPWALGIVLPLGTLFSASLAVNRLTRDSETTAMRMSGVSLRRIFIPIILVGAAASLAAFWIGESLTPWANKQTQRTKQFILGMQDAPPIQERIYFESEGNHFYVESIDSRNPRQTVLRKIMIYEPASPGAYPRLITAEEATSSHNVWTLRRGVRHDLGPDGFTVSEMKFQTMELNLRKAMRDLMFSAHSTAEMSFGELQQRINVLAGTGRAFSSLKVDWHFRMSLPLSCLVLALCAAPLSHRFARAGSYSGVLLGIVVMFLYQNNIWLGKALGVGGMVPPVVAGWSQNVIFGLIGLYLIWREE